MLAETGHFTRAAERRNASQAAFSRRIQSLEAWVGAALIDRGAYPARLTPAGERFRRQAAEILRQTLDARMDAAGDKDARRGHVRIALPYALATSQFARWWPHWSEGRALSSSIVLGNILELVTSLMSEEVDIMFCYESAQQPVHLDPEGFERMVIAQDCLTPFAARALAGRERFSLPGRPARPLPLLMYTPGVYFARLVELVLEAQAERIAGQRMVESDMADVLRELVLSGQGIAWLPESSLNAAQRDEVVALGDSAWTMPLKIIAFRSRRKPRSAAARLWSAMAQTRPSAQSTA